MSRVTLEAAIVLLLVVVNGLFALAEIAVVSARKARLRQRAEEGDQGAQAALALAESPHDFLSTVQIGITLVGILAGAFGGATLSEKLAPAIARIPALAPYAEALAVAAVVTAITYLTVVIGELVPKRLALNDPERVASRVAGPMRALSRIAMPLVRILTVSADLFLKLLRVRPAAEPPVTEEEIRVMIAQGAALGVLSESESEAAQGIFRLGDRRAGAVMQPRTEIVWLDLADTADEAICKIVESGYSCFPVCEGGLDNVLGIVEAKALLSCARSGKPFDLRAAMRPSQFVPETVPAVRLLEMFRESSLHMALVMDEFGSIQGIVTLGDLLDAAMGDITEAALDEEARAVLRPGGSWLLDGMLPVEDFRALLQLPPLPGEEEATYATLGGFVMMQMGRIPHVGDRFEWGGLHFEVMDMDGRRVDRVLVTPQEVTPATEE